MKGIIRQRGKQSWEICLDQGKDPKDGSRRRYYETVRGRKSDAQARLHQLLVDREKGLFIRPERLTVKDVLEGWLSGYVKTNCSVRTLDGYRCIADKHLTPALGQLPLRKLRPQHIQEYYAEALEKGHAGGKGPLSARTVHHHHVVLSEALKWAVRQGYLGNNPCGVVDAPKPRKRLMRTLTVEEVGNLLKAARDTDYYPVIFTAVNSGLRQAELLGLRWRDVNLDLACLSVTRSLYKRNGVCIYKEPKSDHSRRKVDMMPRLAVFLRQYRAHKQGERLLLARPLTLDDLVFSNTDGKPLDPGTLTHKFARIARTAGLTGTRFHDLRHTFASLMLLSGANPKTVSEALGHASPAFTLQVYSHLLPGIQKAAMERLDMMMGPTLDANGNGGNLAATFRN